jgi:hypothetical protein
VFEHRDPTSSNFVTFELSADDFELYQGDIVAPGCDFGVDIRSGSMVSLDCWGRIATVYYNPMNHSYLVMICRIQQPGYTTNDTQNNCFAAV